MQSPLSRTLKLAAVGLVALAMTGCNASAPSVEPESEGPTLILVTPAPAGADQFLQLSITGIKDAATAVGGTARVFESQDASKVIQQLDAAVAAKPDVIAVVGFEFGDALGAVAPKNPDQAFLYVDACVPGDLPNVTCAVFREHEGVFLAGAEAGLLTNSNRLGAVVALDTPQIRRFSDPFGIGAQFVNPDVEFTALFVGGQNPFSDPARAKEQALSLASGGTDIMIASSAGGNSGVFDAASSGNFMVIGVDVNQCPSAPGLILDNVIKKVDVIIVDSIKKILDGEQGGVGSFGLAENAVTLTSLEDGVDKSGCVIAEHPDVIEQVMEIRDRVVSGEITVDDPAAG